MLTSRLKRVLEDDRFFWTLTAWIVGGIAFGKGLMLPNRWSATQAQVDYSFGIVRRGLFGQVVTGPFGLQHYPRFVVASALILLVFVSLLVLYTIRSGIEQHFGNYQVSALFFSSYGFTYVANMIGYFDLILGSLAIFVLLIRNPRGRFLAALPISVIALLIHELFFFIFLPTLILSFLLQYGRERTGSTAPFRRRSAITMAALLALVGVVTTACIFLRPSLTEEQVSKMRLRVASRVDFDIKTEFFDVMTRSATDNAAVMRLWYKQRYWWLANTISLVDFAPTLLLLMLITGKVIRSTPALPGWAAWLATATALSPLAMHLLGFDAARWNAWVVVMAYLILLMVCSYSSDLSIRLTRPWRNAIILAIILNIASGNLLLDRRPDNTYPFFGGSLSLKKLMPSKITAPAQ